MRNLSASADEVMRCLQDEMKVIDTVVPRDAAELNEALYNAKMVSQRAGEQYSSQGAEYNGSQSAFYNISYNTFTIFLFPVFILFCHKIREWM